MQRVSSQDVIRAKGFDIRVYTKNFIDEFISLTDIARYANSDEPSDVIRNWLRRKDTVEFLGLWEILNNPNFKPVEFDWFKQEAGRNSFSLSPQKWIKATNAIGIISKAGRYDSGTYAHSDIAFEFASWISPEFKLYIIKEYQKLKQDETHRAALSWNLHCEVAKINYKIHTDAIKENIIIPDLTQQQISYTYANEADILNVALFGMTAKEWHNINPDKEGNIRDYASLEELLILANMESYNAIMISENIPQNQRLAELRKLVIQQLNTVNKIANRTHKELSVSIAVK